MMNPNEIGALLAAERDKRGLTLYKLSLLSGVTIRHLHQIEEGKYDIRVSTLQKILNAYNKQLTITDK